MGSIKTLLLKRIGTENTESKGLKILSIVCFIAGLLVFIFGWNMDVFQTEVGTLFSFVSLWFHVLCLWGVVLWYASEIMTIKGDIKDLNDKMEPHG
jgi:hypothetical protein